MTTAILGVAKILSRPINDIYELGKGKFQNKLKKIKSASNINRLYKSISSVHKVKTIWQIDKEVSLKSFYYPPKIFVDDNPIGVNAIKKLPNNTNIVIQGIVGQGKSIFMRYLCYQEIRIGDKVPVFLELRRIDTNETLKDNVFNVLDSMGFEIDDELFKFLCDSGKLVLMLDGFDEIKSEKIPGVIKELELWSDKHPDLQIVISSRPDSGIQRSSFVRVYKLAELDENDLPGILTKLLDNGERVNEIIHAINTSGTKIKSLLITPLMVTLLVIVYKSEQKIPEQMSDFYQNLFPLLLYRHDRSKPGYVRERSTQLNERSLQKIFEAFCFITRKNELTIMSNTEMHDISEQSFKVTQVECNSSDFVADITKVSNLIVEEGYQYHFIHKSVQEFYAANYIKNRPDDSAKNFYKRMRGSLWEKWNQELLFLSQIDTYRHDKYLFIPTVEDLLARLEQKPDSWKRLSSNKIDEILKHYKIYAANAEPGEDESGREFQHFAFQVGAFGDDYKVHRLDISILQKLIALVELPVDQKGISDILKQYFINKKLPKNKENMAVPFYPILREMEKLQEAEDIINDSVKELFDQYKSCRNSVKEEDSNASLMLV